MYAAHPSRLSLQPAEHALEAAPARPNAGMQTLVFHWRPQMPDNHREFTNYQWPGMLRTLRQMLVADAACEVRGQVGAQICGLARGF